MAATTAVGKMLVFRTIEKDGMGRREGIYFRERRRMMPALRSGIVLEMIPVAVYSSERQKGRKRMAISAAILSRSKKEKR